jgi:hypothetical protein
MKATKKKAAKGKPPLTAKDLPDAPLGKPTDSRCSCYFGVVCEDHHDKPWEHDDCHGAGDPCPRRNCPYRNNPDAVFAMIHCELRPGKRKPPVRKTELPDKRIIH